MRHRSGGGPLSTLPAGSKLQGRWSDNGPHAHRQTPAREHRRHRYLLSGSRPRRRSRGVVAPRLSLLLVPVPQLHAGARRPLAPAGARLPGIRVQRDARTRPLPLHLRRLCRVPGAVRIGDEPDAVRALPARLRLPDRIAAGHQGTRAGDRPHHPERRHLRGPARSQVSGVEGLLGESRAGGTGQPRRGGQRRGLPGRVRQRREGGFDRADQSRSVGTILVPAPGAAAPRDHGGPHGRPAGKPRLVPPVSGVPARAPAAGADRLGTAGRLHARRRGRAYLRDLPGAALHLLDGGHWALETNLEEIVTLARGFLETAT